MRLRLRFQRRFGGRALFGRVDPDLAKQQVEAERVEARGEMLGHLGADVDRAAVGMVDAQAAAVQVHLAADRPGQESALAAIFAIADDGVADRCHMDA